MAKERGLDYIGIVDHDRTEGLEEAIELACASASPSYRASRYRPTIIRGGGRPTSWATVRLAGDAYQGSLRSHPRRPATRGPASRSRPWPPPATPSRSRKSLGPPKERRRSTSSTRWLSSSEKGVADRFYGSRVPQALRPGRDMLGRYRLRGRLRRAAAIHADGGIAVLAHPGQLDSWELLDELLVDRPRRDRALPREPRPRGSREGLGQGRRSWPGLVLTGGSDDHGVLGSVNAMGDIRAPFGSPRDFTHRAGPTLSLRPGPRPRGRQALRAAAAEAVTVETKGGDRRDLVTRYDSLVQDFLVSGISARLPKHVFLAEEGSDSPEPNQINERTGSLEPVRVTEPTGSVWVIDPIDGTTNFACAGRDFSISVALYRVGSRGWASSTT